MVSGSISLPCSGFFSPFPHGTGSLSVSWEYLALPGGPGRFRQDSSCPALLRCRLICVNRFRLRGFHPLRRAFPKRFGYLFTQTLSTVLQPRRMRCHIPGLGSCAFARHYLRNRCYFLFLRVLRCFSSPGSPPAWQDAGRSRRVAPFGNPRLYRVFAPWRGLSQLVTSFVASESQGILHVPLSPFLVSFACKPLSGLSCRADLTSSEVALVTR